MNSSYVISSLKNTGIILKKSKGQNFLVDKNILNKIISHSKITKQDIILEIGSGFGFLTQLLAKYAKFVFADEFDKKIIPILKNNLSEFSNIEIIEDDFLLMDLQKLFKKANQQKMKIVANIPYNISTPILYKIFENKEYFDIAILMLQLEFASRVVAKPNTKNYGRLSIFAKYHSDSEMLFKVPKTCFFPKPKTDSCVVKFILKYENNWNIKNKELFFDIVKLAFSKRRKNIKNTLLSLNIPSEECYKILKSHNIEHYRRPETLDINNFILISNSVFNFFNSKIHI